MTGSAIEALRRSLNVPVGSGSVEGGRGGLGEKGRGRGFFGSEGWRIMKIEGCPLQNHHF